MENERLFSEMRKMDAESRRLMEVHRSLCAPAGMIEVGAAHMDPFFKANAILEFLSALRSGNTLEESLEHALLRSRDAIKKHNSRRQDTNWGRSPDQQDSYLYDLYRRVHRKVTEGEDNMT